MISRYLVIALALGLMVFRLLHGAWIPALGLAGLAGGLILLQMSPTRPFLKPFAWVGFAITAISMVVVYLRMRETM